jgi:hypothetical protein
LDCSAKNGREVGGVDVPADAVDDHYGALVATRVHDPRHYDASLLIPRGESVTMEQARLGHASDTETLDTDAH